MRSAISWLPMLHPRRRLLRRWTRALAAVVTVLVVGGCSADDAAVAGLVADYPLEGGFASSVDGAPTLEPVGDVSLVDDGDRSGSKAATFDRGAGLQLDARGLIGPDVYSVAMRLQLDDFEGWSKLIDYADRSVDDGFYAHAGAFQFWRYPLVEGRAPVEDYATVVVRRDAAGTISWFVDGVHQADIDDVDDHGVFDPPTIRFFLDDTEVQDGGIEETSGRVAWISIYDRALPDATIIEIAPGSRDTSG